MTQTKGECKRSNESFKTKEKGKTNRVILNGYWIWWCYKHNQPMPWCEKEKLQVAINKIQAAISKTKQE